MFKRAKAIVFLPLIVAMVLMSSSSAFAAVNKPAAQPIGLYVQDKLVKPTIAPIVKNGRVYVEFRSVVKALGFAFNYDSIKKVITADSEDASFKIDLKTGQTYVNGRLFIYEQGVPMIIDSGANTLVIGHLFHATNYLYADYYANKKIVKVYEDPWGKPKKSDLRTIQSVIKKHYADAGSSSVTNIQLKSWGSFVTMTVDAAFSKNGAELLDRIERASIEMERGSGTVWTIHDIKSEIDYVDYASLADKEVAVSEVDKAAIQGLLTASVKALNEKSAKALVAMLNPDAPLGEGISSIEERDLVIQYQLLHRQYKVETEKDVIVVYQPNRATVYDVRLMTNSKLEGVPQYRQFKLLALVKGSDGKWYLDPDNDLLLDEQKVSV